MLHPRQAGKRSRDKSRQEMFIDRAAGFDLLSPFVSDEETSSSYGAGIVTIG